MTRARGAPDILATPPGGIALALVVVCCSLALRLSMHGVLVQRSTFTLFALAVMVCARFGGGLSGVAATLFSAVAGFIFFLGPTGGGTDRIVDVLEVVLFALVGLGITWLAHHLRAATLRAEKALEQVRMLTGLLPICAWCKKIRDERGYWQQLEQYIIEHSEARFTHGLCQECARRLEAERQAS